MTNPLTAFGSFWKKITGTPKSGKGIRSKLRSNPLAALGTAIVTCAAIVLVMAAMKASPDFIVLVAVMMALGALLLHDIFSRRRWEKQIAQALEKQSEYHDRLVREVARNRNDLAYLKEGLADAASTVEAQGRQLNPGTSPEARMIETIVAQLGALGARPRAGAESRPESRRVMELEMAPPPSKAPPVSDLDAALASEKSSFDNAAVLNLVQHALRNDTINVFVQPVVSLPQRKVRLYEVYARISAGGGNYLPAAHYLDVAQSEQLMPALDNLLLLRCLQLLRDQGESENGTPYVLNVTAGTLNDRSFMGDLVSFIAQNKRVAHRLVFELPQSEIEVLDAAITPVLDGLSRLGCRFSMDRVRKRLIDIDVLKARHIRFIKMDAAWLLKEGGTKNGYSRLVRFKKDLDAAGIDLIVEKIEDENTLRELLDYNIDFGQGYLFGKPDLATAITGKRKAA